MPKATSSVLNHIYRFRNIVCRLFPQRANIVITLHEQGETFLLLRSGFEMLSLWTLGVTIKEITLDKVNSSETGGE